MQHTACKAAVTSCAFVWGYMLNPFYEGVMFWLFTHALKPLFLNAWIEIYKKAGYCWVSDGALADLPVEKNNKPLWVYKISLVLCIPLFSIAEYACKEIIRSVCKISVWVPDERSFHLFSRKSTKYILWLLQFPCLDQPKVRISAQVNSQHFAFQF